MEPKPLSTSSAVPTPAAPSSAATVQPLKAVIPPTGASAPVGAANPARRIFTPANIGFLRRLKPRHLALLTSFALLVVVPWLLVTAYLFLIAADQYHSRAAFSIRSEDKSAAVSGLLGTLSNVSTGSASDANILYEYIRSQKIVEELEAEIKLSDLYRPSHWDPVFGLAPNASIDDLLAQWGKMTQVTTGSSSGILQIQTEAFTPQDAQKIAGAILERSSALVNRLSANARSDAVRFAKEDLALVETDLKGIRREIAEFRRKNRIIDPRADAQGQLGILTALQQEMAQSLIQKDQLSSFADDSDPRMKQLDTRIESIRSRINAERKSLSGGGGADSPDIFGDYEELLVKLEFANAGYMRALEAVTVSLAEAQRKTRYIAIHVEPTLAQDSLYPRRLLLSALSALFLFLGWSIIALFYYNVRDNR